MYRCARSLSHRPARDGSVIDVAHVPAYLALEIASEAWAEALAVVSGGSVTAAEVMMVNVTADFSRELLVGTARFETTMTKLGRTSLVLEVLVDQHGHRAARAVFTLVRVEDGRSSPFRDDQRSALDGLVGA